MNLQPLNFIKERKVLYNIIALPNETPLLVIRLRRATTPLKHRPPIKWWLEIAGG